MKTKTVWLRNPLGDPKKTQFKVTESEISLGNFVVPASEVQSCKVGYAKKWLFLINMAIGLSLSGWFVYETSSFLIRLQTAVVVAGTPGVDEAATRAAMVHLLNKLHLRASTTDEQQTQLALGLYVLILVYGIFIAPNISRPRVVLTARGGSVVEVPYRLVRPRKFAKTLAAARKVAKGNKKAIPKN
jgi:hypothetical protein